MSFLQLPPLQSLKLSTPFLHGGCNPLTLLSKTKPTPSPPSPSFLPPNPMTIKALITMRGRVVCSTNDKTVAVEVVRLVPHPKYKRRIRKKKKYQAHDPDNQFKVGDTVQLVKSRPISKTKAFVAVPVSATGSKDNLVEEVSGSGSVSESGDLAIPFESQQQQVQA